MVLQGVVQRNGGHRVEVKGVERGQLLRSPLLLSGSAIGSTLGVGAMGPRQARRKTMEHRHPEGVAEGTRN